MWPLRKQKWPSDSCSRGIGRQCVSDSKLYASNNTLYVKSCMLLLSISLPLFAQPNRAVLQSYHLSTIYADSHAVSSIYKRVLMKYNQLLRKAKKEGSVNLQAKYSWSLMSNAIFTVFPKDVWKALSLNDEKLLHPFSPGTGYRYMEQIIMDSVRKTHCLDLDGSVIPSVIVRFAFPPDLDNYQTLYTIQDFTCALMVTPKDESIDIGDDKRTDRTIKRIIGEIEGGIRGKHEIASGVSFRTTKSRHYTPETLNFRIFQLKNISTSRSILSLIDNLTEKHNDYLIQFVPLRKSCPGAYKMCGYMPRNEPKWHPMDTVNGMDDISGMIKYNLKSIKECKIKLLLLMGCFSYHLATVFQPFVENIICIHPHCEIEDIYTIWFGHFLYEKLAQYKRIGALKKVPEAFKEAKQSFSTYIKWEQQKEDSEYKEDNERSECMKVLY